MKTRFVFMGLFAGLLAGCANVQPIDPDKSATVGEIVVDPQLQWARINTPATSGTVWTIDGLGLDELRFYPSIEAGHDLTSASGGTLPKYNPTMLPDDVAELFAGTLGAAGFHQVHTSSLRPVNFGNVQGFRFDITYVTTDGLDMKGTALATQRKDRLDAVMFIAPKEFYFDKYYPSVDKLFASAHLEN